MATPEPPTTPGPGPTGVSEAKSHWTDGYGTDGDASEA